MPPRREPQHKYLTALRDPATTVRLRNVYRLTQHTLHGHVRATAPNPVVIGVERGVLTLAVNGKPYKMEAGMSLWIPPNYAREIPPRTPLQSGLDYRVHFSVARGAENRKREQVFARTPLLRENAWEILALVRLLYDAHRRPRIHGDAHVRGLLLALVAEFCEPLPPACASRAAFSTRERDRIHELLLETLVSGPTVKALAQGMGLSLDYFSRKFFASYRVSPRTYIKRERIRAVAELLQSTPLSLKEICFRFSIDKSLLLKQFRSIYGLSPTQYRRANM